MSFSVTVLGCSGVYQTRELAASGFLVEIDDGRWLVDMGGGTWRNLLLQADYRDLKGVFLSHRHPDHTIDIWQLFHARHYGDLGGPETKIPLWAPRETLDRLSHFDEGITESFDLLPVDQNSKVKFGGARATFARMKHPPETYGVRIEHGGVALAYTADTGIEGDIDAIARDAQVFLCEATVQDSDEPWWGHMCASDAGRIAVRSEVGRLVLTHLRPDCDRELSLQQARRAAPGLEVHLASDGMKLELG
ncbi:MAG: MBL fold metallo-hydrolase [Actinomycetota bacterium]